MQTALSTIQRDIDLLKEKKAQALASKQASEARLQEIEAEMRTLGVSPETIEAEIASLRQQVTVSTEQLQAMIANIKAGNYQAVILGPIAAAQPSAVPTPAVPAQPTESVSFTDDLFANL